MKLIAKVSFGYETAGEIVNVAQGAEFEPPEDREAIIIGHGLAEPAKAKDEEPAS